jgi:hypothetical protein
MARRRTREQTVRPRRRLGVFALAALAVLAALAWLAPTVLVHTSLRDRPLEAALAGIDGRITSRAARWRWLGGIEYRDVVVADAAGRPAVIVPSLVIEKGLLGLALDPRNLGTVRLSGAEAVVAVRPGGSSLEDILAPWLATNADGAGMACELELVGGTIEVVDTTRSDAWRITDLFAAGEVARNGSLTGWTAAGRVRHAGRPDEVRSAGSPLDPPAAARPPEALVPRDAEPPPRLDRTTIPAAAAAALARDGGWSVSAPASAAGGSRVLAVTTHRLPLGISSVAATRFGLPQVADGLAEVRLDVAVGDAATQVQGRAVIEKLAVCDAATLGEKFALERVELPLDVVVDDRGIAIRELRAVSPVAEAELSGRLPPPGDDAWAWLEAAVLTDCVAAARIDLAAAARSLPGGLVVRDDVRLTGGSLQLSAVTRADGAERVLEVRLDARNLAAVRAAAGGEGERFLRWSEPLTAWLRGRRGPGREAGLRIEEARLASPAAELSATGTPAALRMQWTIDLGGIVGELAEVLDFGGLTMAGKARGRLEAERAGGGVTAVKLATAITDFELAPPGRPVWRDESLAVDAELIGSFSGQLAAIERARGVLASGGDSLEVTLAGGVLVDTSVVTGQGRRGPAPAQIRGAPAQIRGAPPWIRAAAVGGEVTADCGLVGDLGRWYRRLAAAVPELAVAGLELGGTVQATAAVTPAPDAGGDAWRITKATGEIERFALALADRRVAEPRIVATAAGLVRPATGAIEISSAELLSSSLSLRSGGATWLPGGATAGLLDSLLTQVRGRVQWQADLARLADWIVPREVAEGWPLSGRAWGTFDVAETQLGLNLLAEATGSDLVIARRRAGQAEPSRVWVEPQAQIAVELTRPYARTATGGFSVADRLVIERASLESSTVAIAGRGGIEEWSSRRRTEFSGSIAYDWAQLSRLATPWTGGRIRLAGAVNRPFTVRAVLREAATEASSDSLVAVDSNPAPGTLPLPEAWLAATRGRGDGGNASRPTVTLPVKSPAANRRFDERLKAVSLDTSVAWSAAEIEGFPLAAGELAVRLVEGQLAFGPFDLAAGGGRLRGAPWIALVPAPGELVVPPGRVAERMQLSGDLGNRLASWISPLLARATETTGVVSIDTAGARLPLGDPLAGEAAVQVVFEQFEVSPSGPMQPLVNLLGKLQAAVDPRFAVSDKPVLVRVRPEPVRVRLAERRLWHEGLVMDSGALVLTSKGSVAADGSLAMLVEVAFRGDLVGQTPVVATLARTPIAIPLKGTLARPQFDAAAIDILLKRVLENTARGVFDDGLSRGLEAIFGRPPAPPSPPAPLTLPR